jgi:hypothetical protein
MSTTAAATPAKKQYQRPTLQCHGSLRNLTQGASMGTSPDGASLMGMNW